jgi:t-SNARE complex subunit (syntaxin)
MMKNESQADFSYDNLSVSSSSNKGSKKGSISEVQTLKGSQVSQVTQVNQVKFPTILKNDSQKMKNKELEDVLKSINQALRISKDMKDSLKRSDDSVNSIEANIIDVNSSLKQANKEVSLLKNKESGGYFKYFIMLGVSFVIVVILVCLVYRKVVSDEGNDDGSK